MILLEAVKSYIETGLSTLPLLGEKAETLDKPGQKHDKKAPNLWTWDPLKEKALTLEELRALLNGTTIRTEIEKEVKKKNGDTFTARGIGPKLKDGSQWIGIITGKVSGNLEVIDIDVKNDPTGKIWENYSTLIKETAPGLWSALVVVKTVSGGYHLYYRCKEITLPGNTKLANTESGGDIIETRGEAGYVAAPPSPGYEITQGDLSRIPEISGEERELLFSLAYRMDRAEPTEAPKPKQKPAGESAKQWVGLSSFEDYNQRETALELLEDIGWTQVRETPDKIYILRPPGGAPSTAGNSGDFHKVHRLYWLYSGAGLPVNKPLSPSEIYTQLRHNGDKSEAAKELYKLGYGDRQSNGPTEPAKRSTGPKEIPVKGVVVVAGGEIIADPGKALTKEAIETATGRFFIYHLSTTPPEEIETALELITANTESPLFIQQVKNLQGLEPLSYAKKYWEYLFRKLYDHYQPLKKEGRITAEEDQDLKERIEITAARIKDPVERSRFIDGSAEYLGATPEALREAANRIRERQLKEKQATQAKELAAEITRLIDAGKVKEALTLSVQEGRKLQAGAGATLLEEAMATITEAQIMEEIANRPDSLPTGYHVWSQNNSKIPLDLPAGALTIIAALTSHRKTTLMLNMALNIARTTEVESEGPDGEKERKPLTGEVYFISLEESRGDILMKFLNIDIDKHLQENNLKYIEAYFKKRGKGFIGNTNLQGGKERFFKDLIEGQRLKIVAPNNLTPETLGDILLGIKQKGNPVAVFVDYIQLLKIPGSSASRQNQLQEISALLREAAKETGLPIILGAQFKREVAQEKDIDTSMIREAGDIGQDANLVLGLWDRAQTKEKGSKEDTGHLDRKGKPAKHSPGILYVEVLKGRNIGTGYNAALQYDANTWKIRNGSLAYTADTGDEIEKAKIW
jgi:replicative DNA helicase